jgi:mannose-6-phosphate isomerase-like protein (cupin superfamily)
MITSVSNSEHYQWGNNCDGWFLLKSETLSVIQEKMPPGSCELLHYHQKSQQVFFILSGSATFEVDGKVIVVKQNESIHIQPGLMHRISNESTVDLDFLVISEPKSHGDRINC